MMLNNPVYGSMFTLWFTGMSAWLLRNVPSRIMNFLESQFTTKLVLNDAGFSNITLHYASLLTWALKQKGIKNFCRNFTMRADGWYSENDEKYSLGIGYGKSYFIYKRRIFCLDQTSLNSGGSDKEKSRITITGFTRNKKLIEEMVNDFRFKKNKEQLYVYTYADGWEVASPVQKRNINTVIIEKNLKNSILENINYFINNKEWFLSRGLPYKKTILFHGKPGTGKTSLIKAIASNYDRNIYSLNLNRMVNASFEKAMASVPKNSIIIIEDFDSCKSTHSRENNDEETKITEISLSTILNTLDGVISLDGTLIFMTTNHIEKIDSALLRKGRVDEIYDIPYLTDTEIKEYISLMFPDKKLANIEFKDIAGCEIQSKFMDSKDDFDSFIESLP